MLRHATYYSFVICQFIAAVVLCQTPAQTPPSFTETVLHQFQAWDLDHDGKLTDVEIDKAALDPQYHDAPAAALAALHKWLISVDGTKPMLTKDWFSNNKPVRLAVKKTDTAQEKKEARKAFASNPGSLQGNYVAGYRRLQKMNKTVLFAADPELNDIRQGALGDCYVLAPLGALVHRNPTDIKQMILENANGYTVKFADGQTVQVGPMTDSELAMGGSSTKDGLWIRVMEKAYGTRKIQDGESKVATDSMRGGSTGTAGKAFTGHKFSSVTLQGAYKNQLSTQAITSMMDQLRKAIPKVAADNLLMTASTPKKEMPKSISQNHAYAVFGYDAVTDRITLWNPHGNNFSPKGPEGPTNGYKIVGGVFSIPLEVFVKTFGRIMFEEKE